MGVSEGGDGGGMGVDCRVGTIVWVRRRNGSWWPGRILGQEELSASHLMSPRSGTPVKLLGREDASVDWYNLEKSKRVKEFRCGEFDACIEKAEASLGVPIKKREKYARREDAILHALELERKQLELKQPKQAIISNGITNKPLVTMKREFSNLPSADTFVRHDELSFQSDCAFQKAPLIKKPGLLFEENVSNCMISNDAKNNKPVGNTSGAVPQMRGLQDFGFPIARKKRIPQSESLLTSTKFVENDLDTFVGFDDIVGGRGHANGGKSNLAIKNKRSHGGFSEESSIKKRDRRRPLVQVLQTSAKIQAPHCSNLDGYPHDFSLKEKQDHMGVCQAKRSSYIYLSADSIVSQDDKSNSSEETRSLSDQCGFNQPGSMAERCSTSEMSETNDYDTPRNYLDTEMEEQISGDIGGSLGSNCDPSRHHVSDEFEEIGNDEVPSSSNISTLHPFEQPANTSAGVGISKWHIKGKRNHRSVVKMPIDGKICIASSDKWDCSTRETANVIRYTSSKMEMERCPQKALDQGLVGEDFLNKHDDYRKQRHKLASKAARDLRRSHIGFNNLESDSHLMSTSAWEADEPPYGARGKYWEESDECYDPVYAVHAMRGIGTILFDVDLRVKASYQGERVPLVSLMSRLNAKAIVGHPIQIEILEDDSTAEYLCVNHVGQDEHTAEQPVWRTARRTVMQRVPRSNPVVSSLEDDEAVGSRYQNASPSFVYPNRTENVPKIANKKVSHHQQHQSSSGKIQKRSHKRLSLPSQKTRTLSSFTVDKRFGGGVVKALHGKGSNMFSGLIEPAGQVPSVTCVPMKIAFSRILEAIGRPSALSNRVRIAIQQ
ncbi:uncharacterized protein At1g51745-like [Zingiber officinale]|uniref:PWWP domain-containing protein n=1 Tax=Zingiber officinale TaxID=94328 RepID=A0A8J5ILZ3_ZINOF|nr:uncharacterized protein At1g51745-like [Zingiber officinale]KAG6537514.1 hypothetical protein ZIOFF_002608 [Zingiber officinale]